MALIFNAGSSADGGVTPQEVQEMIAQALQTEDSELREFIRSQLVAVMRYKGQVATEAELPTDAELGDFYNVLDSGKNFAFNGEGWDDVTKIFDVSDLVTKEEFHTELNYLSTKSDDEKEAREAADLKLTADVMSLKAELEMLDAKLSRLSILHPEEVTVDSETTVYEDTEKDFIVSGTVSAKTSVIGNTVTLKATQLDSAPIAVKANTDVTITENELTGTISTDITNTAYAINADGFVTIKDCTLNPESAYNAIEIGLSKTSPKGVVIDNVDFAGKFSNNAISVFSTTDNAVITISNCHFENVSNAVRLSNRDNRRVTINILNCTFDKWEKGQYSGMIICQDYTSSSAQAAINNNLFAPEKVTINIQNCIGPNGKIEAADPEDICGTKQDNQLLYVYADKGGFVTYDAARYPKLNIN